MSSRSRHAAAAMLCAVGGVGVCLCGPVGAFGQAAPGLHHRAAGEGSRGEDAAAMAATVATGHTTLPATAEGEYPLSGAGGKLGEEIELYFEHGRLYGYLTVRSVENDDRSAPITFDFATTHVDGHSVAWTTRKVHGESWAFDGELERGLVATPQQPGYYLLAGSLIHYRVAGDSAKSVILKREPGSD